MERVEGRGCDGRSLQDVFHLPGRLADPVRGGSEQVDSQRASEFLRRDSSGGQGGARAVIVVAAREVARRMRARAVGRHK